MGELRGEASEDFAQAWSRRSAPITQNFIHRYYDYLRQNASEAKTEELKAPKFLGCIRYTLQKLGIWRTDNIIVDKLLQEKEHATSYDDWLAASVRLDELTQKERWKQEEESSLYDWSLVKYYTEKMRAAREKEDWRQLLYIIRTTWVRDLGNICNVNLYRHSHVGTKYIVEEYLEESKRSLHELVYKSNLDVKYMLSTLIQTRKNIGRTALVLSGGSTFGLFHVGVLSTLFDQDLVPRVISGTSAGAMIASIMCVHHKHELRDLVSDLLERDFNIFQDDSQKSSKENFFIKLSRFLKNGTWFSNKNLIDTMMGFLGDLTFREAYNRTGKILSITVSPESLHEQPRLLNYLTAPNVLIWSAVCASCSVPGVFPSSTIYEKDPKTNKTTEWNSSSVKFVDGSVDNDLPIAKLSEMFNVDHIIACQVNIHVFPFLKLSLSCVGGEVQDEFSARLKQNLSAVYNFCVNEVIHLLELGSEVGIARNFFSKSASVLSQQYSGDITILPNLTMLFRIGELLTNPTKEFLLREAVNGARATWPKISIIKNHCEQEFELDRVINYLKGKLISNPSQTRGPFQIVDSSISLINSPIIYHQDHYPTVRGLADTPRIRGNPSDRLVRRLTSYRPLPSHGSRAKQKKRRKSESSSAGLGSPELYLERSVSGSTFVQQSMTPLAIGNNTMSSEAKRIPSNRYNSLSAGRKSSSSGGKSGADYANSDTPLKKDYSITTEQKAKNFLPDDLSLHTNVSPELNLDDVPSATEQIQVQNEQNCLFNQGKKSVVKEVSPNSDEEFTFAMDDTDHIIAGL
ncbi:HEL239Wp [Eremothecium sinecaudum]|uniref:Patatin-like phospholipase domain-containing protein n=1 Tax=Eremothecium sinecaudum TaxID=45286 RepID=A0A0X8HT89_9SACH|nr:HEL239Wp [Eremothecium sinecaudum]AMD21042.1 HEL239Wp [Eremothecium sinecaudum]